VCNCFYFFTSKAELQHAVYACGKRIGLRFNLGCQKQPLFRPTGTENSMQQLSLNDNANNILQSGMHVLVLGHTWPRFIHPMGQRKFHRTIGWFGMKQK
jgi:hypothetical protein